MTFSAWLRLQAHRDDPVGDLARDFIEGVRRGDHGRTYRTPAGLRRMLDRLNACPSVMRCMDRAEYEYASEPADRR